MIGAYNPDFQPNLCDHAKNLQENQVHKGVLILMWMAVLNDRSPWSRTKVPKQLHQTPVHYTSPGVIINYSLLPVSEEALNAQELGDLMYLFQEFDIKVIWWSRRGLECRMHLSRRLSGAKGCKLGSLLSFSYVTGKMSSRNARFPTGNFLIKQ